MNALMMAAFSDELKKIAEIGPIDEAKKVMLARAGAVGTGAVGLGAVGLGAHHMLSGDQQ